jgi:hypothetical protein
MGKLGALIATSGRSLLFAGVVGCAGSDSSSTTPGGAGGGGDVSDASPGVAIAHEYNLLVREAYDLRCKVCPCGGFSESSPAGEACTGAVFDLYPGAKRQAVCKTDDLRAYAACLKDLVDCAAADACNAAKQSADAQCPPFDQSGANQALPSACTNVM